MSAPGTTITTSAISGIGDSGQDLGTWFVVGITEYGPVTVDEGRPIYSLADFVGRFGGRVNYGTLYDSVDAFFRVGGAQLRVARVVGPGATLSTLTLNDRATTPQPTLTVKPKGPGAYGARIGVQVIAGSVSGTYALVIFFDGVPVEQSPDLSTPTAAVEWATNVSQWVTIVDAGSVTAAPSNLPATGTAAALTGGSDDRASITDTQWSDALANFGATFGPGLVSMPGRTTTAAHTTLITHAAAYNRQAILEGPADATQITLTGLANSDRSNSAFDEYGAIFAPWLRVPGVTSGTTRSVPPSSVAAGLISRQVKSGSANVAAAGQNGVASWVTAIAQSTGPFTDAERDLLNSSGVNVFRRPSASADIQLYGYRSLDGTPAWRQLNNQLLRLRLTDEAGAIGDQFVFDQMDGRGQKIAEFNSAIAAMLQEHWADGSLFGETADAAFRVDTGPGVNTAETIAAGELRAVIAVRMSPMAEFVEIQITKYPITDSLVN